MNPESLLQRLIEAPIPESAQERIREKLLRRIVLPAHIQMIATLVEPSGAVQNRVWQRILERITVPVGVSVFEKLRAVLTPPDPPLGLPLLPRLALAHVRRPHTLLRWTAGVAVCAFLLRLSPFLFVATPTLADSGVILIPTRGSTTVSLHQLWQPVAQEALLQQPVEIRTTEGEATLVLHDDGNIRLGPQTHVALHDLSDRPEPTLNGPTLTLFTGQLWLQGFLPAHLRGVTVVTPQGEITVHEGSISIDVGRTTAVHAWNRHATVAFGGHTLVIIAGEMVEVRDGSIPQSQRIASAVYDAPWVVQNLERDAVHRTEVSQLQQERRAAHAGILPNSVLYPVKRVAEAVDVLLTFGAEERVEKQLDYASMRLREASALIAEGSTAVEAPLNEYRQTLLELSLGSGSNSVTQFLLRQHLSENAADVAILMPGEDAYPIKRAVLEATAALPDAVSTTSAVEGILLVDALHTLTAALEAGDLPAAQAAFGDVQPYLPALESAAENNEITPELRREASALLEKFAVLLHKQAEEGIAIETSFLIASEQFLPEPEEATVSAVPLSPEAIAAIVGEILDRTVGTFRTERALINQIQLELRNIEGNAEEPRILEMLYRNVENHDVIAPYVRWRMRELRRERRSEKD